MHHTVVTGDGMFTADMHIGARQPALQSMQHTKGIGYRSRCFEKRPSRHTRLLLLHILIFLVIHQRVCLHPATTTKKQTNRLTNVGPYELLSIFMVPSNSAFF